MSNFSIFISWTSCSIALVNILYIFEQLGPIIHGMFFLITPAFSKAISSKVSPKTSMWSIPIEVIAEHITLGYSTILVASNDPPSPHSSTT